MKSNFEILPIFFDIEKLQKATNELLVYDTKVKDAYLVIDILGNKNDFEKSERNLKRARDGIKPYVKGKIYQGFASGVKKFINKRGGKV